MTIFEMQKNEHLKIFIGKKLILEGDFWIPRVGKCRNCDCLARLPDDIYCEQCQENLYKTKGLDG